MAGLFPVLHGFAWLLVFAATAAELMPGSEVGWQTGAGRGYQLQRIGGGGAWWTDVGEQRTGSGSPDFQVVETVTGIPAPAGNPRHGRFEFGEEGATGALGNRSALGWVFAERLS